MKKNFSKMHSFFVCSKVLRDICLVLLMGIILIGIRALIGDFVLSKIHILDVIIHYLYFIGVLGYLCMNIKMIYLYINESKGETQNKGNENQLIFKQILGNVIILTICIVGGIIIMWCEGADKVVDWIALQYGLIIWIVVLYVGGVIKSHILTDCKDNALGNTEIRKDLFYIPKLLEKIEDEKLKNHIAHELYTYAVRARFYKYGYYICSIAALVAPTIVVILNSGFSETVLVKFGVSIFSGIAAVASGMLGIVKFKESWTRYRYNCEVLKAEVAAYINNRGDYENVDKKEKIFYERINVIINGEINEWKKLRQENDS